MAEIDWKGDLEAYHTDGRVVSAWLDESEPQPDSEGDYFLMFAGNEPLMRVYHADGTVWQDNHADYRAWRIRNASKPSTTPDDLNERCRALVQSVATGGFSIEAIQEEAKSIIAAMNPVDPDLIEARDCVALPEPVPLADPDVEIARDIIRDSYPEMKDSYRGRRLDVALAAIRRGRALERDSRDG